MHPIKKVPSEKDIKKKGRSSFDYRTERNRKIVVVKLFDAKATKVDFFYIGSKSTDSVKFYDRSIR